MLADIHLNDCLIHVKNWSRISGIPQEHIVRTMGDFLAIIKCEMGINANDFDLFVRKTEAVACGGATESRYSISF
jgi:hypothetical protein